MYTYIHTYCMSMPKELLLTEDNTSTHAANKAWVGDYGHPWTTKHIMRYVTLFGCEDSIQSQWMCVSVSLWFIHVSMIRINQSTMLHSGRQSKNMQTDRQIDNGWEGDTDFTTNEDIWFLPLLFKNYATLSSLLFSPLLLPPPSFFLCLTERRLLEFELSL